MYIILIDLVGVEIMKYISAKEAAENGGFLNEEYHLYVLKIVL